MKKTYDYPTWNDLFGEITYAHEAQYPPHFGIGSKPSSGGNYKDNNIVDVEYITFYKLTLYSNGELEYKGQWSTFNPKLWPRVKLLYKLFEKDSTIDILYGGEND